MVDVREQQDVLGSCLPLPVQEGHPHVVVRSLVGALDLFDERIASGGRDPLYLGPETDLVTPLQESVFSSASLSLRIDSPASATSDTKTTVRSNDTRSADLIVPGMPVRHPNAKKRLGHCSLWRRIAQVEDIDHLEREFLQDEGVSISVDLSERDGGVHPGVAADESPSLEAVTNTE